LHRHTLKNSTNDYHFGTVIVKSISSTLYFVVFSSVNTTYKNERNLLYKWVGLYTSHRKFFFDLPTPTTDGRPRKWGYVLARVKDYLLFNVFDPFCGPPTSYLVCFVGIRGSSAGNKAAVACNHSVPSAPELGIRRVTIPLTHMSS